MTIQRTVGVLGLSLAVVLGAGVAFGRGFGDGGGGFRGGGGGFRGGNFGGYRGGDYGGFRCGDGGMSSFNRTPSFSSAGSFDRERGYGGGGFGYGDLALLPVPAVLSRPGWREPLCREFYQRHY